MFGKLFDGRFGYQHMNSSLDSVQGYWVMNCVRRENRDRISRGQGVDGSFISIRVPGYCV